MKETDDLDGPGEQVAVFPVVSLPTWVADIAGYVLVAAAVVTVAAGVVRALFVVGIPLHQRVAFADRVQLLARSAGAFPAVLALLGAVCLVMADANGDTGDRRRAVALRAAGVAAVIVLVANLALCTDVLLNADSGFSGNSLNSRLATVLDALAPLAVSGGVLYYVVLSVRSEFRRGPG